MSEGIPENFNGYILPDGRCVSLEDTEAIFELISLNVEDRRKVIGILRGLVDECLNAGLLGGALAYLDKERSLTDEPADLAKVHLTTGLVFERMRDYRSAADRYKEAFELPKEEGETWYFLHNNLGYCLNQLGQHDEAEKYCRTAIDLEPRRHNAYKNLGLALLGQGRFPEAAALFLKAAYIFPPDPRSLGHLEELLADHREEVELETPDIALDLAAAIEARRKLMQ